MLLEYFGYWVTVGIIIAVILTYIEFVSTGELELKLNDIPILVFTIIVWPIILIGAIGYTFEKFGNKSIFKITRKEKK